MSKSIHVWALALGLGVTLAGANANATADGPDFYAVTRVSGTDFLALRNMPSSSGRIVARIPFNAIKVRNKVERRNGWCKVQYQQALGWAACRYLTESAGQRYYATQNYSDYLNIRRAPSMAASVVGRIPPQETGIQGTGECKADWCPIDYQGVKGWVSQRYLMSWSF